MATITEKAPLRVCRACKAPLTRSFVDLGMSPLSNSFRKPGTASSIERFYPLHAFVCSQCYLVQLEEFETPEEIFTDYAYFSSFSKSWLEHCEQYTTMMVERFSLNGKSLVVELASNDGYLLQYFMARGIPVLGIEPASNVAQVARTKGIPTESVFFGTETAKILAEQGRYADVIVGNNVLAHVPNVNDFVAGMKILLKPSGVLTMEFPHLVQLMQHKQFDTIYHEHFSYFSFTTAVEVFARHGLTLFDVEELPTHGGSLRIYGKHQEYTGLPSTKRTEDLLRREAAFGVNNLQTYSEFTEHINALKRDILSTLIELKRDSKQIVGYGAPAKGNTLLNFCGIRTDFLDYTVDRSPHKQGLLLPGTHIPIYAPEKITETRPDYVFILPWNLKEEIMEQMSSIRSWGGKFIVPIPRVEIC
jgi:2-polyprenyl-3-methyl-5-hydroxy-6-metoxy-1,4-benzoquinol methylase